MTTFTASNGIQLNENGSLYEPHLGESSELRAARLEWAQDALTPKLPTEPGVYVDKEGDSWYLTSDLRFYLLENGDWSENDNAPEELRKYSPFTPIEEHIEGLEK